VGAGSWRVFPFFAVWSSLRFWKTHGPVCQLLAHGPEATLVQKKERKKCTPASGIACSWRCLMTSGGFVLQKSYLEIGHDTYGLSTYIGNVLFRELTRTTTLLVMDLRLYYRFVRAQFPGICNQSEKLNIFIIHDLLLEIAYTLFFKKSLNNLLNFDNLVRGKGSNFYNIKSYKIIFLKYYVILKVYSERNKTRL
jgi:hypothetical protein